MAGLPSLLLGLPLALFAAWLVAGSVRATHAPAVEPPPPAEAQRAPLRGFPPPEIDLPAGRLEERVDGAADYLRSHGCSRLLAWRLADPAADLEVLLFATDEGASKVLARDAEPRPGAGVGDVASIDSQSVLFRRGPVLVRLIGDPPGPPPGRLLAEATRVDRSLSEPGGLAAGPAGRTP